MRESTEYAIPVEYASRAEDPHAQQAALPIQPLAHLDLRVLHRAGAADIRSVRAGVRHADGALARRGAAGHRHRRIPRPAAGRRAGALHHPLHRGSAESAVSARLLHVRVERGHHVRACSTSPASSSRSSPGQWYLKQIYRYAYFPIAGSVWLLGALGQTAARDAVDKRRRARAALLLRHGVGDVHRAAGAVADVVRAARTRASGNSLKLAIFLGILAFVGNLARLGRLPANAADRSRRARRLGLTTMSKSPRVQSPKPEQSKVQIRKGWQGWDDYAPFYDWENAQTLDRRDVTFWRRMAARADGPVLELGCGTGRVTIPVARTGARVVGVDRSRRDAAAARGSGRSASRVERSRVVAARRHPRAAVPSVRALRSRDGAVRHSAVARQRVRSEGDARSRVARARAGRHVRPRSRSRCAGVEGVPQPGALSRSRGAAAVAHHAGRVGPAGSREEADDVRPGVRRAARARAEVAPVLAGVPHADGSADDQAARARRIPDPRRPGRLQRRALGCPRRRVADSRGKV